MYHEEIHEEIHEAIEKTLKLSLALPKIIKFMDDNYQEHHILAKLENKRSSNEEDAESSVKNEIILNLRNNFDILKNIDLERSIKEAYPMLNK